MTKPSLSSEPQSFATPTMLEAWMKLYHGTHQELWVRMFKKGTGTASVTWDDCVQVCIAWGWIDGIRRTFDDVSFVQRLTPRRPKSMWSQKNCDHAERLIKEGRMQPSGLVHVEAAKREGRWEKAYVGSSTMVIPEDFLARLKKNRAAQKFYDTLNRTNLFAIYHRLQTAKRPETREKRMVAIIEQLAANKPFH